MERLDLVHSSRCVTVELKALLPGQDVRDNDTRSEQF